MHEGKFVQDQPSAYYLHSQVDKGMLSIYSTSKYINVLSFISDNSTILSVVCPKFLHKKRPGNQIPGRLVLYVIDRQKIEYIR